MGPDHFYILATLSLPLNLFDMESSEKPQPLLQRPESAGIEITDFSFSKPVSHKPSYSRNRTKQPTISHPAIDNARSSRESMGEEAGCNQLTRPDTPLDTRSVVKEGVSRVPILAKQPVFTQPPSRLSTLAEPNKESGRRSAPGDPWKQGFGQEHAVISPRPNEPTGADSPRVTIGPAGRIVNPSQECVVDIEKTSKADFALPEPSQVQAARRERQEAPENPPSREPFKPMHNQLLASKRRQAPEKEACSKPLVPLVAGKNGVQLSEDDLFELLITRMRQREESEHAAAVLQRQVTNENEALKKDNSNLQDGLKKCQGQLAKTSSESRSQRAQIDKWKAKLGTFKGVLNELGREYGAVREQAEELKEATMSLDREKREIQNSLDEIRLRVSDSAETIQDQRERLSLSEGTIASLREALDHSEKRGDLVKSQLSNEQKRIATLETYIQNESQSQSRCLALVRNDQGKITEKLDIACELFTTSCSKSQDNILSKLSPALEHCLASVQGLKEQCSAETTNVQDFTNSVHEATSRFTSLAGQVANDVDRSTELSKDVLRALQEAVQAIEGNLGPHSSIFEQLANSDGCYGNLQRQVQNLEPVIGSLDASIKAVGITETDLVRGLETFSHRLAEARIPAGNPVLEMEVSKRFAENTQLQLQLKEISIEVESLRKQLANKSSENEHLQHALTETVTSEKTCKSQNARLEIEKTALRGELQFLEQRIRNELGSVNIKLQDQMKAGFEGQIQGLKTEKAMLERDFNNLQAQLATVQISLTETEKTTEDERLQKASMLQESKKRIEELTISCSEFIAEAKAYKVETNLLKSSEASLSAEKDKLLKQLEEAEGKTSELEASLGLKTESGMLKDKAIQEAEKRAEVFELETAKKNEELSATKENLAMLKSRSSALEKVGEEADAEIISLLRRAQEAESWQATIREGFAKVIEVHPDEPFENTWQRLEDIIQSSLPRPSITYDAYCTKPHGTGDMEGTEGSNLRLGPREEKHENLSETIESKKGTLKTAEDMQTDGNLPPSNSSPLKALKHGDCVDSLPKFPAGHSHIVPFSLLHDRLSRENSLSLFNDPAELEMLFVSTPDIQGALPDDATKKAQERQMVPAETFEMGRDLNEPSPVLGMQPASANDSKSGRSQSALGNIGSLLVDKSAKNEQFNTKRKVVSFEGTRVITQTEIGKARRMSDATDNSSGGDSESKAVKRTQQRTYSRLRQSVAQSETSIETTTEMQPASKSTVKKSQQGSMNKADHSSNANPRPLKRPRNAADGPERRLSPKGLASVSSRSGATAGQANTVRGRSKRRTRGDRYNQRFGEDVG